MSEPERDRSAAIERALSGAVIALKPHEPIAKLLERADRLVITVRPETPRDYDVLPRGFVVRCLEQKIGVGFLGGGLEELLNIEIHVLYDSMLA